MTILLSNQGTVFERETDVSATICARDYKGFGNQAMTAVVENAGGGRRCSHRENPELPARAANRYKSSNND